MSKERELLARVAVQLLVFDLKQSSDLVDEIQELLAQPEHIPDVGNMVTQEPVAWKVNLIDHFQSLYDTEMLRTDEGEYLILLEDAICAVEEWSPSKPERMTDDEISAVTAGHDPTPYGVHMFKMGIRWYEKYKSRVGVYDDSE